MAPASIIAARIVIQALRHLLTVLGRAELMSITAALSPLRSSNIFFSPPGAICAPAIIAPQRSKEVAIRARVEGLMFGTSFALGLKRRGKKFRRSH
jgi:hypothetical protein